MKNIKNKCVFNIINKIIFFYFFIKLIFRVIIHLKKKKFTKEKLLFLNYFIINFVNFNIFLIFYFNYNFSNFIKK